MRIEGRNRRAAIVLAPLVLWGTLCHAAGFIGGRRVEVWRKTEGSRVLGGAEGSFGFARNTSNAVERLYCAAKAQRGQRTYIYCSGTSEAGDITDCTFRAGEPYFPAYIKMLATVTDNSRLHFAWTEDTVTKRRTCHTLRVWSGSEWQAGK